jgi:hypothetical protein
MRGRVADGITSVLLGAGVIAFIVGFGLAPLAVLGVVAGLIRRF